MSGLSIVVPGVDFSDVGIGNTVFPIRRGLITAIWPGASGAESVKNLAGGADATLTGPFVGTDDYILLQQSGSTKKLLIQQETPDTFTAAFILRNDAPIPDGDTNTGKYLFSSEPAINGSGKTGFQARVFRTFGVANNPLSWRIHGSPGCDFVVNTGLVDQSVFTLMVLRASGGSVNAWYGRNGVMVQGGAASGVSFSGGIKFNFGSSILGGYSTCVSAFAQANVIWTDAEIATLYRQLQKIYTARGVGLY